jgi:excisionase family DNA binding protein
VTEPEVLTVLEVATLLRCSRNTAYMLVSSREIPSLRIGRSLRVRRESLEQWLQAQETRA